MDRDDTTERGRNLEEEYFRRRDRELVERARAQAAEAQKRQLLQAAIGVDDDEVLTTLGRAGLDDQTAALLEIAPVVQVAWADGSVSDAERRAIDRLPKSDDVRAAGELGGSLLSAWLDARPPEAFFAAVRAALRARLERLDAGPRAELLKQLIADAESVAAASGGVLGLGAKSANEVECIRELREALTAPGTR